MRIYDATRYNDHRGAVVTVTGDTGITRPLEPRYDLANHSPDGFEWGYPGSGPAQLALAMLADATDADTAQRHYQQFKWYLAQLKSEEWTITDDWVKAMVFVLEAERRRHASPVA